MNRLTSLYEKALALEPLTLEEGQALWFDAPLDELMAVAHEARLLHVPGREVTWQIDRNINISNICAARCLFCNFHSGAGQLPPFTTTLEEYEEKIEELIALGGDQVLLQGGLHPQWGLEYYETLFRELRSRFPTVRLHALGPPEIVHIARLEQLSFREVLERLHQAGLSSLPGAGAEILSDRVREIIAPRKATVQEWLAVMREAHRMGLLTSATMMYGHVETIEERLQHLVYISELQADRPEGSVGFLAFIPWPFQWRGTQLAQQYPIHPVSPVEHLRWVALSRLMLHNIAHIQASWLTVGVETSQLSLWGGADDMGSVMIEENVVASAGTQNTLNAVSMRQAIRDAGFTPRLRDQAYNLRD